MKKISYQFPPPYHDEADVADENASCASSINSLDLKEINISSIIWSIGFNVDYSYIKLPLFDTTGKLIHKDGIPEFPGIYFIGYPWMQARKSAII